MNDLQVRFSELPLEMQKDVERAIEKREQQVKEAALDKLREKGIVHLDPTYDRDLQMVNE
ncbi:MAG: hypothetical protein LBF25_01925 [Puniceicoccales bacterium]|jgi:hypothetical protein|nr:hypothetical protein [Puniceicoccales bacterium]